MPRIQNAGDMKLVFRWLVLFFLFSLTSVPRAALATDDGYPGRFSTFRNVGSPEGAIAANTTFTLGMERVLKIHALVPRRQGDTFGAPAYAGSFTLHTPGGGWAFDASGVSIRNRAEWPETFRARVIQSIRQGGWQASMAAGVADEYPAVWVTLHRQSGMSPLSAGLIGYGWAKQIAPTHWRMDGRDRVRAPGRRVILPVGSVPGRDLLLSFHDTAGFRGILSFSPRPTSAVIEDDGLTWTYAPRAQDAKVVYIVIPGDVDADLERRLARGLAVEPIHLQQRFGSEAGPHPKSWVEFSATSPSLLALPASSPGVDSGQESRVAGSGSGSPSYSQGAALTLRTVQGAALLVPGPRFRRRLERPPLLEATVPIFPTLSPVSRLRIGGYVRGMLARQYGNGSFSFSEGRAFYDGLTLSALAEVLPQLDPPLRQTTSLAIARGLGHLWKDQERCPTWPGVMLPPEQPAFIESAVDYPEVEGCVLQATLLYSAQVNPTYPRDHWPDIEKQFRQLRSFMDYNGIALAHPGPAFWHVIAESAIGGYLDWQALYHLSSMAGHADFAAEARARASFAWHARNALFRWRPELGQPSGVVNGIIRGTIQCFTEPTWAYVQSTFFTFLPCFSLPEEDRFGIWRMLELQPWWEYTGPQRSTQRVYDAANAIALFRAGRTKDVNAHWSEVSRPFAWRTFDETPAEEIAALCWLAAPTPRPKQALDERKTVPLQ